MPVFYHQQDPSVIEGGMNWEAKDWTRTAVRTYQAEKLAADVKSNVTYSDNYRVKSLEAHSFTNGNGLTAGRQLPILGEGLKPEELPKSLKSEEPEEKVNFKAFKV
jgi:hypothetical protein